MNEQINRSPVRLIGDDNSQIGVVTIDQALAHAREVNLDLVEISPESSPPVCRIMDFGKYLYEQKRKDKLNLKKQHTVTLKELRIRPKTDKHDCDTKVNHAREFFRKGHRVQFTMMFRGREMAHTELGQALMNKIITDLEDVAKVEQPPLMQGKRLTVLMMPKAEK
ncbi:MAG: translation initiation factor IF-3 [Planctomycetaceae bacterium]|nr:translation initiation factor IF-3 [Planctomycetaceae bacterium]